jgi:hypothetical protein
MWDVGCGMWDVGCGMWDFKKNKNILLKMKKILTILFSVFFVGNSFAQSKSDSVKIKTCSLDYIEGWYNGDTARMERALHPDLVKMQLAGLKQTNGTIINAVSKSNMIEYTKAGFGKATPREKIKNEVVILDIYEDLASVRLNSYDYVDYLQLVRCNGEWKILTVIWKMKTNK